MSAVERITNGEQRRWAHSLFTIERTGEFILTRFKESVTTSAILARNRIYQQLAEHGWRRCDTAPDNTQDGWFAVIWQRA